MSDLGTLFLCIARVWPWTDEDRAEFVRDNRPWLSAIPQREKRVVWSAMNREGV